MSDDLLKYQCLACGAPLKFDPEKQLLMCESCGSEFQKDIFTQEQGNGTKAKQEPSRIDWRIEGYIKNKEILEDQPGFICTSCGAEIVSDGNTVATECMYCQNPVVMSENIKGMVKPDYVIPFKINKKQAEQLLRDFYKGKKLLPDAFKDENRISKISGLYVPFWLFSCSGNGSAEFTATKTRSWSDSNYRYTNIKTYSAYRSGNMSFLSIPVDASTKMDDNYMDGLEPYYYKDMEDFKPMYMAGYFADKFDVGVAESSLRVNERVINSVIEVFEGTVKGYSSVKREQANVQMTGEDIRYALLPVWMLNTKYKDKVYQFAINAQTGKVSGELPIDKKKLFLWRLALLFGSAIPAALIFLFISLI